MSDPLAVSKPITRSKAFTAASASDASDAANTFIATLEADPDKVYTTTFLSSYFDGTNHVITIAYTNQEQYPAVV